MKFLTYILFIAVLFSNSEADPKKQEPPIRTRFLDGRPIPPFQIKMVHEKDCDPNGWRWGIQEWERMDIVPKYDTDSIHGSNHGYCWG